MESLAGKSRQLFQVDGPALVEQAENPRALNMIMLGVLAGLSLVPFSADELWSAADSRSKPRVGGANRAAFQIGLEVGRQAASQCPAGS